MQSSRPISGDSDDLAPLETVAQGVGNMSRRRGTSQKGHERSNSHDSYFERKLSQQFGDDNSCSDPDKMDSNPDLSEIQVNFELEENELRMFGEDAFSASLASDLSKSPHEEKPLPAAVKAASKSPAAKKSSKLSAAETEAGDESPKSLPSKMSFREKLKRFTSPTPVRQQRGDPDHDGQSEPETIRSDPVKRTSSSIREKLVCALRSKFIHTYSVFLSLLLPEQINHHMISVYETWQMSLSCSLAMF
jgi:hypothetical protein